MTLCFFLLLVLLEPSALLEAAANRNQQGGSHRVKRFILYYSTGSIDYDIDSQPSLHPYFVRRHVYGDLGLESMHNNAQANPGNYQNFTTVLSRIGANSLLQNSQNIGRVHNTDTEEFVSSEISQRPLDYYDMRVNGNGEIIWDGIGEGYVVFSRNRQNKIFHLQGRISEQEYWAIMLDKNTTAEQKNRKLYVAARNNNPNQRDINDFWDVDN